MSWRRKQVVARAISAKYETRTVMRVCTLCAVIFTALSSFLAFNNNNNNKNNNKNYRSIRGASPPNAVKPDVRACQCWSMDGVHYIFSYASVTSSAVRVSFDAYIVHESHIAHTTARIWRYFSGAVHHLVSPDYI